LSHNNKTEAILKAGQSDMKGQRRTN